MFEIKRLERIQKYKSMSAIGKTIMEYGLLTLATFIMVIGIYAFKFPNNFSFGGVTGIAVVLSKFLPSTPGSITFIINMALLVMGFIFLGKGFGVKTAYISILMSLALSFSEKIYPMSKPLTEEPVLELVFAVALPAVSSAIFFNMDASSGGTDIIAMILQLFAMIRNLSAILL